ncbi:MAG: transitional endoplasmic reticulum ATPase [Frankiaceae bacterium]|nr:transitional endoplasmic reticulum ATPase [Frankiaceae bacterium]
MSAQAPVARHPEVSLYHRNAARVTSRDVLHALEKDRLVEDLPRLRRRKARPEMEALWRIEEEAAREEARAMVSLVRGPVDELAGALDSLAALRVPELLGKVDIELQHVRTARTHLDAAEDALVRLDFGAAGAEVEECERELWLVGAHAVVAMNRALAQAAVSKDFRGRLEENVAERRQAKLQLDTARATGSRLPVAEAAARLRRLEAAGYALATEILAAQVRSASDRGTTAKVGRENSLRVVPPQQLETFADVGGLEDVKEQLRETIGTILERPDEAARYHVVHNGVLFYGPPGTGKNLLSRALAGEYGLRYLRFSPATIASAYIHEAAANLRHLFELARQNTPCMLYLDEIDTIASDRSEQPSAEHREVVTQLMICLEEYRSVPGLVIAAGTNDLDRLDPALREGRFDAKIHIPLPDPHDREDVFRVQLTRRGDAVEWDGVDLSTLARMTNGYNAAALETIVSLAAQAAMKAKSPIDGEIIAKVIEDRGGQHRISLDERITWDDVVLAEDTRDHVMDILNVFSRPDVARELGVRAPAGIVLYGPPGTGKTTIARAMASQIAASFYELSAADLLSKWAGESEQRVAKLFAKARANRPSIIFIDEIDALLRRRSADTTAKWEERVLSQFLRELDGLKGGDGVLLVGATNRIDTIDEAIVGRRLEPIEVGLPDAVGRLKLLQSLCRSVKLAKNVNLRTLTAATEGMSGADLKRLRDTAGMRALGRVTRGGTKGAVSVTMADFQAALEARRSHASMAEV